MTKVIKNIIQTNTYVNAGIGVSWLHRFAAALLLCVAGHAGSQDFTFAAFGDAPYTEAEEALHIDLIAALNRALLAFVIHVGDFKSSWIPCTDALFQRRHDEFSLVHHPLIYTPGDNDWTDCWRTPGAPAALRNPLERLQKLRSVYFRDNRSLGQRPLPLARQSTEYPEHARWIHNGLVFATLNMPGGDNNARLPGESAARTKMVGAWIAETFRVARKQSLGAVVLAMQANPWSFNGSMRKSYAGIMNTIAQETLRFDGEVLLIHGDTHHYRVDHPLMEPSTRETLRNFTRIEVFGSPFVNWVRIDVKRQNGRVRFEAAPGH